MKKPNKKHREAIQVLLDHLAKFGTVDDWLCQWIQEHAVYRHYRSGDLIYGSGSHSGLAFYVCAGLISRVVYEEEQDEHVSRCILSVGTPRMALLTTDHLFSTKQSPGNIVALRNSQLLILPYHRIKCLQDNHRVHTLISALERKKKKQQACLRGLMAIKNMQLRYIAFATRMPELRNVLTQAEQQDLLGISRSTIQRSSYFLLTGKIRR